MIASRTEIYDQPDSEGWWWNEGFLEPLHLRSLKKFDGTWDYLYFIDLCQAGQYASKTIGKWQKIQSPIWPQMKANNVKKTA